MLSTPSKPLSASFHRSSNGTHTGAKTRVISGSHLITLAASPSVTMMLSSLFLFHNACQLRDFYQVIVFAVFFRIIGSALVFSLVFLAKFMTF
jgi:hypothetical protein